MKAGKFNRYGLLIIYSIIFVILNVLIFVIFKPANITEAKCQQAFWWSYAFITVAFLLQFATIFTLGIRKGYPAIFMGLPLFMVGLYYFVIEFIVGLIFMILAVTGVPTPLELVIILQCIILAAFVVVAVLALMAKNTMNHIEETRKQAVTNIRFLVGDLELAANYLPEANKDLKKEVLKVSEDVKYSDPMSCPAVAMLDQQIQEIVMQVKFNCQEEQPDEAEIKGLLEKLDLQFRKEIQRLQQVSR